ncbi:MAG: radical SAM protein [Desulfobacterales bacterium]|nr:radical SAM protein [Desulfobacterales bacterium]
MLNNMHTRFRSQVPDIIYSDYRYNRIEEVKKYLEQSNAYLPEYLHRVTLFTTYRCNLNCIYCKTIQKNRQKPYPAKDDEVSLAHFRQILEMLSGCSLKHIHFTGGEATVVNELPEMVELARKKGILCSITSNGMTDKNVYEKLVSAGLSEIRISLDTHDADEFDRIVRRTGAYARVLDNIRHLIDLRDQHKNGLFVIINMCVGKYNRHRMAEFVRKTLDLNPNDIKLITVVQSRNGLGDFTQKQKVLEEIRDSLSKFPQNSFPLLRYKLKTVFSPDALGVKDLISKQLLKNCFIPLTERTLDTKYYYPCSVYLREGGKPLGRIDEDDLETQQAKTIEFMNKSNCLEDSVCREYCINCCKKFNLFANWKIHKTVNCMDGSELPISNEINLSGHISSHELEETMQKVRHDWNECQSDMVPEPFIVIKPGGMKYKNRICEELRNENITVKTERHIPDWNEIAIRIYTKFLTEENIRRSIQLNRALPHISGDSSAAMLILKQGPDISELKRVKKRLREMLSPNYCLIRQEDDLTVTALNYIHTPDPESWSMEYKLLIRASSSQ